MRSIHLFIHPSPLILPSSFPPNHPGAPAIPKPKLRSAHLAPLLVRPPNDNIYTPEGRSRLLSSLGISKDLHDPATKIHVSPTDSWDATESDSRLFFLVSLCPTCGLTLPHLQALNEHIKESHDRQSYPQNLSAAPPNPVFNSHTPHSAPVRRPQQQQQQHQHQPQLQHQQHPQLQRRRSDGMESYHHDHPAPPATSNPIFDSFIPPSTEIHWQQEPYQQPQPQLQPQNHQHPRQQHEHPHDMELYFSNYSAPPDNPIFDPYIPQIRRPQEQHQQRHPQLQPHPDPPLVQSPPLAASTPSPLKDPKVKMSLMDFAMRKKKQREEELARATAVSPQHSRQQHHHSDDMKLAVDSSPASSFASPPSPTPVTTSLVPHPTQRTFSNVLLFSPSLSQTSSDYGTVTSPPQASQEATSASNSQPDSPYSLSTPLYSPSSLTPVNSTSGSRVESPVATQGQAQASYHPPSAQLSRPTSPLLSEPFRFPNPEAPQALLAEKGVVEDGNDHTRAEIAEGELLEEREMERPPFLFVCGVGDCQRRYKDFNDLRTSLPGLRSCLHLG